MTKRYQRHVRQLTIGGSLVAEYESLEAAAAATGRNKGAICRACQGKLHKTGGYRWEYATPNTQTDHQTPQMTLGAPAPDAGTPAGTAIDVAPSVAVPLIAVPPLDDTPSAGLLATRMRDDDPIWDELGLSEALDSLIRLNTADAEPH
jgi:hypothetical protein